MSKKAVIVVLIVLAILFIVALSLGVLLPDKPNNANSQERSRNSSWMGALDSVATFFAPALNRQRVSVMGGGCKKQAGGKQLALKGLCRLRISSQMGEDNQNANLEFPAQVALKVYAVNKNKQCEGRPRKIQVTVNGHRKTFSANDKAHTVLVDYVPQGKSSGSGSIINNPQSHCWVTQDKNRMRLVVMEKGGTLIIQCLACTAQSKTITASFK